MCPRTNVAGFLARGVNTPEAIEAAKLTVLSSGDWRQKSATLSHMHRYYTQRGAGDR